MVKLSKKLKTRFDPNVSLTPMFPMFQCFIKCLERRDLMLQDGIIIPYLTLERFIKK